MTETDDARTPAEQTPPAAPDAPDAPEQAGLPRFVTKLSTIEQQVGRHVITALQHEETVAVLTTTVSGAAGDQHLISVPLTPPMLHHVQALLRSAASGATPERIPCVGFHCYVDDAEVGADAEDADEESTS